MWGKMHQIIFKKNENCYVPFRLKQKKSNKKVKSKY